MFKKVIVQEDCISMIVFVGLSDYELDEVSTKCLKLDKDYVEK